MRFGRSRRENELDDEIQAHFAMALRDRIDRGEDPREAELAVRREFGNRALVAETARKMWGGNLWNTFWQDVRYALRGMQRSPVFTTVAVLSLALGIGANTAIFTLIETIILRTLPVERPEQLVELLQKYPGEPRGNGYWTEASYKHFRANNHVFSTIIGTSIDNRVRLAVEGAEPEMVVGESVLGNYFQDLGVKATLGRTIVDGDDGVAVVSWTWWKSRFNLDPNILGKRILVQDVPATIVGVAPRAFAGLRVEAQTSVWTPRRPGARGGLVLLGRLKPGTAIEQARAEMAVLFRFTIDERSARSSDPLIRQLTMQVEPAGNGLATVRDTYSKPLTALMAVVGLLLLLACANIASMLLARGSGRQREMALRTSLGASRARLLRQMLTESMMLSLAGTVAGVFLAYAGTMALLRILASGREHERIFLRVHPDLQVLAFVIGIAVAAALLFGLLPALSAFHFAPALAMRQSGTVNETPVRRLLGKGLVAVQIALSLLLVSTAALFISNLANLKFADLGFKRDHVLLATLDPSRSGLSRQQLSQPYQRLLQQAAAIPGVRSVSLGAPTPLQGAGASGLATVEGFVERPEDKRFIAISFASPQYFETLGIPLLAGRGFSFGDLSKSRVAVINQTMARYYFSGRDPIGKHVTLDHVTLDPETRTYEIIGVVRDAHYMEIRETVRRSIYLPAFFEGRVIGQTLIIRTDVDPEAIIGDVQRAVRAIGTNMTVARTITLADQIDASIVPERLIATLSGFFGLLGAVLVGIGIYGLLAYTVARRTNEIGIRMALGANRSDVSRMVLRDASAMVFAGLLVGIPIAMWGRAWAASLIRDFTVQSSMPLIAGATAIIAVALLASFLPANRAARVDPMVALRHE